MPQTIKKPSFNVLYVLKFPRYYTTWRLHSVTQDGYFIFLTSTGREVEKMSLNRFNFLCSQYLVDTVSFATLNLSAPTAPTKNERVKITIESNSSFRSREYTKEELEALIDNIDDIEW